MANEIKTSEELADEALNDVSGGAKSKPWICANCHNETYAVKAKNNQSYCIPCYTMLFGND